MQHRFWSRSKTRALVALAVHCSGSIACQPVPNADAQRPPRPVHPPPIVPLRSTSPLVQDVVVADVPATPPPVPTAPPTIVTRGRWVESRLGFRTHRAVVRLADGSEGPWITVRVPISRMRFDALRTENDRLASGLRAPNRIAMVAGYFERDKRPSGVLEANRVIHGQQHSHAGSGLFVVRDGRARVIAASSAQSEWAGSELAVQCGPRLVEPGPVVGVYADRGERFARAAACIRDGGATVDFIVTWSSADALRGPGLYAFALALAGPSPAGDATGCETALNLDGGPSAGIMVDGVPEASHPPIGPVPWAIVLGPR
jgi:uncharacterized protein YigE (DUF2233 family)